MEKNKIKTVTGGLLEEELLKVEDLLIFATDGIEVKLIKNIEKSKESTSALTGVLILLDSVISEVLALADEEYGLENFEHEALLLHSLSSSNREQMVRVIKLIEGQMEILDLMKEEKEEIKVKPELLN